jgi:hypothetical protein
MARYRLKSKLYGVGEAVQNTIGGVAGGTGKALDSTVGGLAGGLAGAHFIGNALGNTVLSGVPGAGIIAPLLGAGIGSAATRGLGKGLKYAADSLQS